MFTSFRNQSHAPNQFLLLGVLGLHFPAEEFGLSVVDLAQPGKADLGERAAESASMQELMLNGR